MRSAMVDEVMSGIKVVKRTPLIMLGLKLFLTNSIKARHDRLTMLQPTQYNSLMID